MNFAVIALTDGGARLARRIVAEAGCGTVYLPAVLRIADDSCYFDAPLGQVLPELFGRYQGLICIMATGIVVRLLAPYLRGKQYDPAVVVMDEGGRFAISLLSGHLGGANELARELAELVGAQAVITTATDVNGLPAWDDVARRAGLVVEPVANIKHLNRMLLEGQKIALVDRSGRVAPDFADVPGVFTVANFSAAMQSGAAGMVFVTNRLIPGVEQQSNLLLLRPRDLVVGIGCNRGTSADEIETVVRQQLKRAFLSSASLACLASISEKADEAGLLEAARRLELPVEFHPAEELNRVDAPSPDSPHALAAVGARGVCEPAAIRSAGGGRLLVAKQKCGNVTLAIAEKTN